MKNLSKKTNGRRITNFTAFLNVQLSKSAQKALKGGDDIIVVEDVIDA